jgi:ribosomal protein S18 acetylase RimI-like enzyme
MKKGLEVVKAARSDAPALGRFMLEAWKEAGPSAPGWTGASRKTMLELSSKENLTRLLADAKFSVFLAKGDGKIEGFAANRRIDEDEVELAGVVVEERYTGKGVGTALVDEAIGSAAHDGYSKMLVKTETFNRRAIGFYEAEGFRRAGTGVEKVGGKRVKLAVLRRRLETSGIRGRARQSGLATR